MPAGSVLTLPVSGRVADRFGLARVLRLAGALNPVALVPLGLAPDLGVLMAALAGPQHRPDRRRGLLGPALCWPRSSPGARSRRLPSSLVASSSLVSQDADAPFDSRESRDIPVTSSGDAQRPRKEAGSWNPCLRKSQPPCGTDTPQTARRFWWLRFARIWPLQFLLMTFAYTAISSQVKSPGPLGHLAELLLIQAWVPDNSTYAGGNGVTWSLSVELFFYLVFPPYRFGEFLLGMVLARAMVLGLRIPAPTLTALVAAAGIGGLTWVMTAFTVRTGVPFVRPFVALFAIPYFAALLCAGATRDTQPGGWWLGSAPLRRLGDWSFALYLVHSPAMAFTARFGWWANPGGPLGLACLLAFLALVLPASAALHYLIEKPVERRLRRLPIGQPRPAS